jgi:hypothetical protein
MLVNAGAEQRKAEAVPAPKWLSELALSSKEANKGERW